mgnify:FL=1
MDAMNKIREKVMAEKPESGARQIGEVVLMIAAASDQAAEIIAADLDNEAMSLDKCFSALWDYARKHQSGGFWGCMCNSFDKANPVVQVICDFYKIPAEAFAEKTETQAFGQPQAAPVVDLLDLL